MLLFSFSHAICDKLIAIKLSVTLHHLSDAIPILAMNAKLIRDYQLNAIYITEEPIKITDGSPSPKPSTFQMPDIPIPIMHVEVHIKGAGRKVNFLFAMTPEWFSDSLNTVKLGLNINIHPTDFLPG